MGQSCDESRSRQHLIAAGGAGLLNACRMHVRREPDEPDAGELRRRSQLMNEADWIERVAIQIEDHHARMLLADRGDREIALHHKGDRPAGGDRSGANLRSKEQVVDDRQDHVKMIPDMIIRTAAVAPFFKNGYVLVCETTREAVLIDPGDEVEDLIAAAAGERAAIKAILLTHAHLDHITGVSQAKSATGAPVWIHRDDLFLYNGVVEQGRMFGFHVSPQPAIDQFFAPGRNLAFGHYVVDVSHTPGHSPGGVCLAIGRADEARRDLFVGDTLFAGSIGRTDLPGGDMDTLIGSIRGVLFGYPDDAAVYSGHGPVTTIGEERRTNPFLR